MESNESQEEDELRESTKRTRVWQRVEKKTIQVQRVLLSKEKFNEIQFEMNAKTPSARNIIDWNFNFTICYCMVLLNLLLHSFTPYLAWWFLSSFFWECKKTNVFYMNFICVLCGSYRIAVLPSTKTDFIFSWSVAWMQNNHFGSSYCMRYWLFIVELRYI